MTPSARRMLIWATLLDRHDALGGDARASRRPRQPPIQLQPATALRTATAPRSSSPRRSARRKSAERSDQRSRRSSTKRLDQLNITNFAGLCLVSCLPSVSASRTWAARRVRPTSSTCAASPRAATATIPARCRRSAVYLDEQPVTTIGGTLDVHIYDIARIESLVRAAGHALRRLVRSGHDPHHHQQAGYDGKTSKAASIVEGNTVSKGGLGRQGSKAWSTCRCQPDNAAFRAVRLVSAQCRLHRQCRGHAELPQRLGGLAAPRPTGAGLWRVRSTTAPSSRRTIMTYRYLRAVAPRSRSTSTSSWTVDSDASCIRTNAKPRHPLPPTHCVGDLKVQHFFPDFRHDRFWSGRADH